MQACGLKREQFNPLMAMVPQICVEITEAATRQETRKRLEGARTTSGERLFVIEELGDSPQYHDRYPRASRRPSRHL